MKYLRVISVSIYFEGIITFQQVAYLKRKHSYIFNKMLFKKTIEYEFVKHCKVKKQNKNKNKNIFTKSDLDSWPGTTSRQKGEKS